MFQKLVLFGRLGSDPEVNFSKNGKGVTKFSIATTENYKKDDEWQEKTSWHRIVCFGKLAEGIASRLKKGGLVLIEGKIDYQKWENKEGETQYATSIIAETIKSANKLAKKGESSDEAEEAPAEEAEVEETPPKNQKKPADSKKKTKE